MHIHAAGDVTGTAGSAAGCQEQGRLCALAAFDTRFRARPQLVPRVAFTIPEAAAVGAHEHELAARGIDYATGRARVRDLVRAQLSGDRAGLLKLLVRRQDRRVVGVHMLGVGAAELIHIGRTVMAGHLAIEHLAHTPFNTPTLAEAYRVAAAEAVAELDAA
jgi:NAD(P) transhydrogenase